MTLSCWIRAMRSDNVEVRKPPVTRLLMAPDG